MIATKDAEAAKRQSEGVKRVRSWLEEMLPDDEKDEDDGGSAPPGKETSVIVNQLACKEAGCPDVEVVMTLLRVKPRPKLMFKVFKAAADLSKEEVDGAMQKALADERGDAPAGDAHDHGHVESAGGHDTHGHDHATESHGDGCAAGVERGLELSRLAAVPSPLTAVAGESRVSAGCCEHDHAEHAHKAGGGDHEHGHSS